MRLKLFYKTEVIAKHICLQKFSKPVKFLEFCEASVVYSVLKSLYFVTFLIYSMNKQ